MTIPTVRRVVGGSRPGRIARQSAAFGRLSAERWLIAARYQAAQEAGAIRRGRILTYHSIGTPQWGVNDVSPVDFERHLQIAADDGWSFATPAEVMASPHQAQLALTFDDGLTSVLANALPVLRHHGIPATAFVVTGWADGHVPDSLRPLLLDWRGLSLLQSGGITLASHSVSHPDFSTLGAGEARRQLETSRERLRAVLGVETAEFAIPYGQSRNWSSALSTAATEAGYTTVYAQCVDRRPAGTVARTFITRVDRTLLFRAALAGAYDGWQEWY